MTPQKRLRAETVKALIERGWSPPPPTNAIAQRILDDIEAVHPQATLDLAPREIEALQLLADGHTYATAAAEMHLATDTVKTYIEKVRHRLGAKNTPHAVALAFRSGILDSPTAQEDDTSEDLRAA